MCVTELNQVFDDFRDVRRAQILEDFQCLAEQFASLIDVADTCGNFALAQQAFRLTVPGPNLTMSCKGTPICIDRVRKTAKLLMRRSEALQREPLAMPIINPLANRQ